MNAIFHGNGGEEEKEHGGKKIHITISVDNNSCQITIKDEGEGFDLSEVPDCTLPENVEKSTAAAFV